MSLKQNTNAKLINPYYSLGAGLFSVLRFGKLYLYSLCAQCVKHAKYFCVQETACFAYKMQ